jgi:hypothetical protein
VLTTTLEANGQAAQIQPPAGVGYETVRRSDANEHSTIAP